MSGERQKWASGRMGWVLTAVTVLGVVTVAILTANADHRTDQDPVEAVQVEAKTKDESSRSAVPGGTYVTIMAGLLWDGSDYQELWKTHVGEYKPVPEGAPNPPGYEHFEAALASLQVTRAEEYAKLVHDAGFEFAIPVRDPGPPYECVESSAVFQCGDTALPGTFMLIVVSARLDDAPDVLGDVERRRTSGGSTQRVVPLASMNEFSEYRRNILDDPALREKANALQALVTPEEAARLRVSTQTLEPSLSVLPDR